MRFSEFPLIVRSNEEVIQAGEFLRDHPDTWETSPEALSVLNDWRSMHESAQRRVTAALKRHTKKQQQNAIISSRTKRLRSIVSKLQRLQSRADLNLATMQDIAGCRVVLDDVEKVELLAENIRNELASKLSAGGPIREDNYISRPKKDGYRSLHFVVRNRPTGESINDTRTIEIQVRSGLQHRWATAVETVDLFTGQKLKSGGGDQRWRRFFLLTSNIFSMQERRPLPPGTQVSVGELTEEMRSLANDLRVIEKLQSWSTIMQDVLTNADRRWLRNLYCYLVTLDVDTKKTRVTPYDVQHLRQAHQEYLSSEEADASNPSRSVVLVKAYSLDEVRTAFPNFYGDTRAFLKSAGLTT